MAGSESTWNATQVSAVNTAQELAKALEAGRVHVLTGIIITTAAAAFGAGVPAWEVHDGTNGGATIFQGAGAVTIIGTQVAPLCKSTAGNALTVTVAAGGAGSISRLNLIGFTV